MEHSIRCHITNPNHSQHVFSWNRPLLLFLYPEKWRYKDRCSPKYLNKYCLNWLGHISSVCVLILITTERLYTCMSFIEHNGSSPPVNFDQIYQYMIKNCMPIDYGYDSQVTFWPSTYKRKHTSFFVITLIMNTTKEKDRKRRRLKYCETVHSLT